MLLMQGGPMQDGPSREEPFRLRLDDGIAKRPPPFASCLLPDSDIGNKSPENSVRLCRPT